MQRLDTAHPDVFLIQPRVFGDSRGFFMESHNIRKMQALGLAAEFVQDNHSRSARGVLRGLHYQTVQTQGKLVRVVAGEVFDVAVDLRRSSAHFGKSVVMRLSAENALMAWIPPGFAHGFLVVSEMAEFLYKTTDY
jgi:dTDP-4-dehydrorhamnose 3,5-epimerase